MLEVINPATGALLERLDTDTPEDVRLKVAKARAALPAWRAKPFARRAEIVQRFAHLLAERGEECAEILTAEVGKPLAQSRSEVKGTIGRLDFFLAETESRLGDRVVLDDPASGIREVISFEPLGVVANVSAWNYPYFVGSNVFVPALLTGNTVVYKPSEYAALTGRQIARLWDEAGLPPDVFQIAVGDGRIGAALVGEPVDGVFFTGSYATGRKIVEQAAGRMVKIQCELGGKDPIYVRADVDPKAAAEGVADGAFYNAGQSCCAVERIYVHEAVYQPFVDAFVAVAKRTELGPVTRAAQLRVLEAQVADAVSKGARLLTGGRRVPGPGQYFEATVLVDVTHDMAVMRDETFGPVIGIQRVSGDAEAIRLMNDTEYGLTAGVYTRDETAARLVLAQVDAGSVYWNCCDRVSPRLPWSGRGHSGIGSTLSTLGIDTFVKPKAWHLRRP